MIMTILTVTGCGPSGLSPKIETTLVKCANVDGVLNRRKTPSYSKAKATVESETLYLGLGLEPMCLGCEPSLNPQCLVSGPNEAQVLDVSLQKESVRDKVIGKKRVYLFEEEHTPQTECGPSQRASLATAECGVVSF